MLLSACDPHHIQFRVADEVGVGPVRRGCLQSAGQVRRFRRPLNRKAFLVGCLDFTVCEPIEQLIVGLGRMGRGTTKVEALVHTSGSEGAVEIGVDLPQTMETFLRSDFQAEVLLFHNHPRNALNAVLDNQPLASDRDRRTMRENLHQPLHLLKAVAGGGRFRYYIGENRFVREFRTPQLLDLWDKIK